MTSKQPFFSQFIESQELSEDEIKQVSGSGAGMITRKSPSDDDEGGSIVTKKYPSDYDEGDNGSIVTKKFPSDYDEGKVFHIHKSPIGQR